MKISWWVFIHQNAVKCMPCFQKISGDLNRREGKRQESSTPPNFWHESPPLACESIVKRCTIAFYNSEMHIWLHMLQLNLCRSRYYWLLAKGHGKIHDGHGKVMEKSWNLICQILWEPCLSYTSSGFGIWWGEVKASALNFTIFILQTGTQPTTNCTKTEESECMKSVDQVSWTVVMTHSL